MQSVVFFLMSSKPKSIFTNDTASVTQFLQFFCPLAFELLLRMTLTVFKSTQNFIYLLYFCFSANIWNIFSGGSRALSLKVE